MRALVAGGGILGTFHAMEALERGFSVTQFESSAEPHASTPRSPGLLAFSRAAPGAELDLAVEAARRWAELDTGDGSFTRHTGSTVVATSEAEAAALHDLAGRADAGARGWSFEAAEAARTREPLLGRSVEAMLHSGLDAVVEPRQVLENLRRRMSAGGNYRFAGGVDIRDCGNGSLTDSTGRVHRGDIAVLCPGSRSDLAVSVMARHPMVRPARIQVVQTERLPVALAAPVSDVAALALSWFGRTTDMEPPAVDPRLGSTEVALTCVQRRNRSLTVGETRDFEEPFGFEVSQRPIEVLLERLRSLLGVPLPAVAGQWAGEVRYCTDGRLWLREDLDDTTTLVTCADKRGITLAPVIASETLDWVLDGRDSGATRPGADGADRN